MKTGCMATFGGAMLLALVMATPAQEAFQRVDARDLDRNPQRYWARGIVFEDVLTGHPRGTTVRLDNQTYERLSTKILGEVYATSTAVEKLRQLPLQKAYLFSGTVLQQEGGVARRFFRGSRDFLYIIQDVSVPVEAFTEAVHDLEAMQAAVLEADAAPIPSELSPVLEVLRSVEQGLFTFAQENGIAVEELFDPDSEFAGMPARLALQEIRRMERTQGFSVQLFLADYSISLLRRRYRPDDPLDYTAWAPDAGAFENERLEVASLPDEPQDDWDNWFAPTLPEDPPDLPLEDSSDDAAPTFIEEEPVDPTLTEPDGPVPAHLRFEPERLEEVLPEPIEFDEEQEAPREEPAPALSPLPEEEIEQLVLDTPWRLPEPPSEIPVIVNADLEEFPGLHDPVASRPWDEPDRPEDDEGDVDVVALIAASPEDLDRIGRPEVDAFMEDLPTPEEQQAAWLEADDALEIVETPALLPFPIPGTDPIPEPEMDMSLEHTEEDFIPSVYVGPFQLSLRHADFLLDHRGELSAE